MICLDSTLLIDFLRNKKNAIEKVEQLRDEQICSTSINIFEVMLGINLMKFNKEEKLKIFQEFTGNIPILNFDFVSGVLASELSANLIKDGETIDQMDCLIAGVMKAKNCDTIVSSNENHFRRIKGIKVESY